MLHEGRKRLILDALEGGHTRSTAELATALGVSDMTIRRDLDRLAEAGLLRRVRGGATGLAEHDLGFQSRARQNTPEKRRIGLAAAGLIASGMSIYLDAGTTAAEVSHALAERARVEALRLRVVTHAVNLAAELASIGGIVIHQLGGEIDPGTLAATGTALLSELSRMNFDLYFMGVTGIDLDRGLTNSSATGIEIKRTVIERARETWVVADLNKWNAVSLHQVARIDEITGLVMDVDPAGETFRQMRDAALRVRPA